VSNGKMLFFSLTRRSASRQQQHNPSMIAVLLMSAEMISEEG